MLVEFSVALEEVCILKRWWLMVRSYLLHIFMNYSLKESENRFQKQQHKLHFSNHKARFLFVVQNVLLETRVRACKTWGSFGRGAGSGSLTSFPLPYSPSLPGYSTPLHTWLTKYGSQVGALTKFPRWWGPVLFLFIPDVGHAVAPNHLLPPGLRLFACAQSWHSFCLLLCLSASFCSPASCCSLSFPSILTWNIQILWWFCCILSSTSRSLEQKGNPPTWPQPATLLEPIDILKSYFILLPKNSFTQLFDGSLVFFPFQQEDWFLRTSAPFPYPDCYTGLPWWLRG